MYSKEGGDNLDELKLIKSAQNGEKKAFNDLIENYYPYVSKFILKLCSDETISKDLTQETFLKLVRSIDKFDLSGKASFATYVMTIAKNCYIDYLRRNKYIYNNSSEPFDFDKIQSSNDTFDRLEFDEVLKAVEALPVEQGLAIKLKYLEGMTLREIAKMHNTEEKTVKSRIHNGIVKLRKALKGDELNG